MCPHCLNTLKNEYPELGCKLEVIHATELVMTLVRDKRIALKYPVADKMAIHDACMELDAFRDAAPESQPDAE